MRIASLLSSATEIVYELGLEDRLVAISHECDWPPEALGLPRLSRVRFDPAGLTSGEIDAEVRRCMLEFGSVYEIDARALADSRPDLILTQAVCEVCAVPTPSVHEAVARLSDPPRVLSLDAHTLEEIVASVAQVADAAGEPARGEETTARLRARISRVREAVADRPRPRVLALEWLEPPFAPGHWIPEMIEAAGGESLIGAAGGHSVEIPWADVEGMDPDRLLLVPCGYALEQAREDADRARGRLHALAPRAVAGGDAAVGHSAYFSRSGPRVVAGIEALAAWLHPDAFPGGADEAILARWS
ncbi:cobalamin-binding protein [Longimicrobium sp.]|uniref:cobalamin-binding protein n=1 Tax=Longimicrobium sp. TaxID=2029185 RepID=UPI002C29C788|nr:cobalamin-binding protein [Longimicrobium sp.]HSU14884.1 cobalamin-binding protein [Longimicrobium sp.]